MFGTRTKLCAAAVLTRGFLNEAFVVGVSLLVAGAREDVEVA
jgi:hypothetical protein